MKALGPFIRLTTLIWLIVLALLGVQSAAYAQSRDPTQPPPEFGVPAAGANGVNGVAGGAVSGAPADTLGDLGLAVLVRDGKPYLASGTRLYAVGQRLGGYKIERIAETEIWLRNGKELKKVLRFTGIVRRAATPERSNP